MTERHASTPTRAASRHVVIRVLKLLALRRGLVAAAIPLAIAGALLSVTGPLILGHVVDLLFNGVIGGQLPAGISKEQAIAAARARGDNTFAQLVSGIDVVPGVGIDFAAVRSALLLVLIVYVGAALVVWAQERLLSIAFTHAMKSLRADIADKVHRLPLSYVDSHQRGELLSRLTNDVDNIALALGTIRGLATTTLSLVAVVVMMLTISPLLALATAVTVPLCVLVSRVVVARAKRLSAAQAVGTGRLNAHIEEVYSGFALVKTFGHQARVQQQFDELNDEACRVGFGAQFMSGLIAPITVLVGNLGYVAVAVAGGLLVATGQMSLGGVQAFILYVRQFNQPLGELASEYNLLQSATASAHRVFELLDAPEMRPDTGLAMPSDSEPGVRVEFEHISFGYRPGTPVIEDLSLLVKPGSTVAIVGPTGAGKSTLTNLLTRFYDVDAGRILVDGVDIATVDRQSLRSRIGMVLQDTWLFAGTIADNIGYGREGATREEIEAAAAAAHLHRFVATLPDGYDTWISEDGGNLSAGEKQLITIARAFLARPQLLILDEATSSIDTGTEVLIQQAMAGLRRDRTCFVIAHRLSTVRDADVILVMQSGRIVEQGSHDELMARRGAYCQMMQAAQLSAPRNWPHDQLRVRTGKAAHRPDVRPTRGPAPDTVRPGHGFGGFRERRSAARVGPARSG